MKLMWCFDSKMKQNDQAKRYEMLKAETILFIFQIENLKAKKIKSFYIFNFFCINATKKTKTIFFVIFEIIFKN